ncbi:MAG TPA: hypothetical protein VFJ16_01540 [Longimicrobium sp.]|nr:hypothetical protein [Longimicrobium sp.]
MLRLTTLAALSATFLAFGCTTPRSEHLRSDPAPPHSAGHEVSTLPTLGSVNRFPAYEYLLVSPSQLLPSSRVRFQGVLYTVAVQGDTVVHVSTADPGFSSPEGLRVGDSLQKVREHGGGEPGLMPGWGYTSALPSGWYAAFEAPERHPYPALSPDARVRWFFQRR